MLKMIDNIEDSATLAAVRGAHDALSRQGVDQASARLTLASLLRFGERSVDKPNPVPENAVQEAIVRTGAYYFGPMFVVDKGTSIPSRSIYKELQRQGFYVAPLSPLNNAQLNLYFIMLKSMGLVSDKHLIGYVKYEAREE